MGPVSETTVSLRFFGDDLDPEELTSLLRVSPTNQQRRGDILEGQSGRQRTARQGSWRLQAIPRAPGDVNAQIREILQQVTDDLSIWQSLTRRFRADLFCGLFMSDYNQGLELSTDVMCAVGARNLSVGLDIYGSSKRQID